MAEHWDTAQSTNRKTYTGRENEDWDGGQSSDRGENWENHKHNSTFPRLGRNDSWTTSISNVSSIPPSPKPRKIDTWNNGRLTRRRKESWDTTGDGSRRRNHSYPQREDYDQNEANWEREESFEENERNWAIEEKLEKIERNWELERKKEENERGWEEARKDHQLLPSISRKASTDWIEKKQALQKPLAAEEENDRAWKEAEEAHRLASVIQQPQFEPVKKVQILREPVAIEERPAAVKRYTTTTATNTDEDLPNPLRISRGKSWKNSLNQTQRIPTVLRAGSYKGWEETKVNSHNANLGSKGVDGDDTSYESWDNELNIQISHFTPRGEGRDETRPEGLNNDTHINIQTASVNLRGGGGDDVSLDLQSSISEDDLNNEASTSERSVPESQQAEGLDAGRVVSSPAKLVFQFKPQRPRRTGSLTPPRSSFPISPLSITQVGSDNDSTTNLNDFNGQNSQISIVSIIKYHDKDIQCDFDAPPPKKKGRPNDGSLPTGGRLAILLVCTCMAVFLQALVSWKSFTTLKF